MEITRRLGRGRRVEKKMPPRGLPLGGLSNILNSRPAVSSQSTGLAGRCRLLGAGEPHPIARSKS